MKTYLFAVQRSTGHEILNATIETSRVSDVKVELDDAGIVVMTNAGEEVGRSADPVEPGETVQFLRWPADDKLSEPVSKPLTRA